jgi:hypothetical protein
MLINPPRQRNLLTNLRTSGRRQLNLSQIRLHAQNATPTTRAPNIRQQNLILGQLVHLGRLFVFERFDAQQLAEQEVVDFDFCVDEGEAAYGSEDLSDESVGTLFLIIFFCFSLKISAGKIYGERG